MRLGVKKLIKKLNLKLIRISLMKLMIVDSIIPRFFLVLIVCLITN
jgi:hypothetical protein